MTERTTAALVTVAAIAGGLAGAYYGHKLRKRLNAAFWRNRAATLPAADPNRDEARERATTRTAGAVLMNEATGLLAGAFIAAAVSGGLCGRTIKVSDVTPRTGNPLSIEEGVCGRTIKVSDVTPEVIRNLTKKT